MYKKILFVVVALLLTVTSFTGCKTNSCDVCGRGNVSLISLYGNGNAPFICESCFNSLYSSGANGGTEELPTPTPSSGSELDVKIQAINDTLDEYIASGNYEGATAYIIEQLDLLKVSYSNGDFSELEQRKTSCMNEYRQRALLQATQAYENEGYQSALDVLYHARTILGGDDIEINSAIEYYNQFGTLLFTDFLDEYFYRGESGWRVETDVLDNTGAEYSTAVRLYAPNGGSNAYVYLLSGAHTSFSGRIFLGYDDRSNDDVYHTVSIYGDDELLWSSPKITMGVMPIDFAVDISGCSQLKIDVYRSSAYNYAYIYVANGALNP
ncbi:MAG: NPCBM/NEW2 domain-containing protein [Clostridia bacterium]|nr:NPCBM/NEW2 domain-containing protein [Clostridia bacterium]